MTSSISTITAVGDSKRGINPVLLNALKFISPERADYGTSNWDALEERQHIPPLFTSLSEMWEKMQIPSIKPVRHGFWRLTPVLAGSVSFLPMQQQLLLVATDGHQALCLKPDGKHFLGLLQNFTPKEQVEMPTVKFDDYYGKGAYSKEQLKFRTQTGKKPKRKTNLRDYEEFC